MFIFQYNLGLSSINLVNNCVFLFYQQKDAFQWQATIMGPVSDLFVLIEADSEMLNF